MSMEADASAIVIGTRRLDLRPLVMADLDDLVRLFRDEKAMRNQCRVGDEDDARTYIERNRKFYDANGFGQLTVIERETGNFVGKGGFSSHEVDGFREFLLSYLLDPKYEQNGIDYDHELLVAMRDFAFDELDFMRLVSIIKPRNRRIIQIAEKTGFECEKEVVWEGMKMLMYVCHNQ